MRLPIGTGLGEGRSIELTAERLINLFAEQAPQSSKSPVVLHGTPGFKAFGDLGDEKIRGMYKTLSEGILYVVCGSTLYQIDSDGVSSALGVILGGGRVGMASNGEQLCIAAGAKGYIYTHAGSTSAEVVDFMNAKAIENAQVDGNGDLVHPIFTFEAQSGQYIRDLSLFGVTAITRYSFDEFKEEFINTLVKMPGWTGASVGLAEIVDADFPGADTVTFIDGFFVFNNRNDAQNGQFFVSALNDGTSFNALDFASAERYDDKIVRVFADHSQLLLFGEESIEVWFNSGAADFAFSKAQGSVIEQGLGARWSIEKIDESVMWLDQDGIVRRMNGLTPTRISTHAVENAIAKSDWRKATSFSYTDEGHEFYVLTCPSSSLAQTGITVVYDAASQVWHERKSYGQDTLRFGFYADVGGKHIVGSIDGGVLCEMSLDLYDDNGQAIIAEMQCPPLQVDGGRFIMDSLELDVESGVLSSGSPKVMLDVLSNRKSDAQQQWRDLGDQGEVNHRVIWRRLGQHRTFTASFKISSPVKRAVMAVYATIRATK
jgi:hypothetical protein